VVIIRYLTNPYSTNYLKDRTRNRWDFSPVSLG
jgi:hypothetical protein